MWRRAVTWLRDRWPLPRLRDRSGATTAEYALLLALVVIMLIGTLGTLGQVLNSKLQGIIDQLSQAGQ